MLGRIVTILVTTLFLLGQVLAVPMPMKMMMRDVDLQQRSPQGFGDIPAEVPTKSTTGVPVPYKRHHDGDEEVHARQEFGDIPAEVPTKSTTGVPVPYKRHHDGGEELHARQGFGVISPEIPTRSLNGIPEPF